MLTSPWKNRVRTMKLVLLGATVCHRFVVVVWSDLRPRCRQRTSMPLHGWNLLFRSPLTGVSASSVLAALSCLPAFLDGVSSSSSVFRLWPFPLSNAFPRPLAILPTVGSISAPKYKSRICSSCFRVLASIFVIR